MHWTQRRTLPLLPFLAITTFGLLFGYGVAAAQSVGFPGPSYRGAESIPTGSKPESKLWWNDGIWWGCLWSADARAFTIHGLDTRRQEWIDTGTAVDVRPKSRADCLWDGAKLYIASHEYTDGLGGPGDPIELYRYSYHPRRHSYSLDVGFPTLIADAKSETLVIDEDSTGTLWAVWTAGLRVWIAHTRGDDRSWSPAAVHPRSTSDLDVDDIASVVSFQGKIGVMWSDQVGGAFRFTVHADGAPADAWSPLESVLAGAGGVDDGISLRAAGDGRVFAALELLGEIRLAVRSVGGTWTDQVVASSADAWHHPILLLDEEDRTVRVFGTATSSLGAIHAKSTSMDAPAFAAGRGTPVIRHENHPSICEASSTKQSVSGATGLVVVASHDELEFYVHHHDALGGPRLAPPVAVFHADQREGFAPVSVQFLDASTGGPTRWSWSFGDGGTSTLRNPEHTYQGAGSYTVTLQVSNSLGSDVETRAGLVRVEPLPAQLVLKAIADGTANEGRQDENAGGLELLRVRGGRDTDYRSFLKFFVPPSQGRIASAVVRLGLFDASTGDNGTLVRVNNDWTEPGLTWSDMPALGTSIANIDDNAETGTTVDVNVSSVVTTSGTVSFGIRSSSFHSVYFWSREGATPPELRLTFSQAFSASPEPRFEASRIEGRAPLTVQFFDASNGQVDTWSWDFGDGGTSDVQNPSHTFRLPGLYMVRLTAASSSGASTWVGPELVRVVPSVPIENDRMER